MDSQNELNMLVSGVIDRDGVKKACIYFSRPEDPKQYAEGYIPDCKITSSKGFSDEEIAGLETYLKENLEDLKKRAAGINPIKAMMKE